jgi:hypothetical protein
MKKLILSINLLLLYSFNSISQNQVMILAPNFCKTNVNPPNSQPLPTFGPNDGNPLTGYDGQKANYSQNIQVDAQGNIVFFMVDENIYDRYGRFLDRVGNSILNIFSNGFNSESLIIPFYNEENCVVSYRIISTYEGDDVFSSANMFGVVATYSVLNIEYQNDGTLVAGAGLEIIGELEGQPTNFLNLRELAGNQNYLPLGDQSHTQHTYLDVVSLNNGNYLLSVLNESRLVFFNINQNGNISYLSNILINDAFDNRYTFSGHETGKNELESIFLPDGNVRLAFALRGSSVNDGLFDGIYYLSVNQNGQFLSGTNDFVKYPKPNNNTKLHIKGLEFSADGSLLYVSHTRTPLHNNVLDLVTFTGNTANKTVLDFPSVIENDFEYTQIERWGNDIIIAANNRLAKISSPVSIQDYFVNLNNYTFVSDNPSLEASKIRLLQDQIDNLNYASFVSVDFDKINYTATQTATWLPGQNPITPSTSNTVFIENELRIPAGINITIKDMVFHFAPNALVVLEPGGGNIAGGRLTLENTTFTVDERCVNELWEGIIVAGSSQAQSLNFTTNSTLTLLDNSLIEHARIGARSFSGGIIRSFDTKFLNNHIGVLINPYTNNNNPFENLCRIERCEFNWNNEIKQTNDIVFQNHIRLIDNRGVNIVGNKFLNSTPFNSPLFRNGSGVVGFDSRFFVVSSCNENVVQNCADDQKNYFENLEFGVWASNPNQLAIDVDFSLMKNCRTGVQANTIRRARITRNKIHVRESDNFQTFGIVLENSRFYVVEENFLTNFIPTNSFPTAINPQSFGIVIRNSGTDHNEIYKNYFENLNIGTQAESINGVYHPEPANNPGIYGLQWKCNVFIKNIQLHDIAVANGLVDYNQGYMYSGSGSQGGNLNYEKAIRTARNKFSLTGENKNLNHDIQLFNSQDINYVHLSNPNQTPDSYSIFDEFTAPQFSTVFTDYQNNQTNLMYNETYCPNSFKLIGPRPTKERKESLGGIISELTQKLEAGDNDLLLEYIRTHNNVGELKPILLDKSPLVSDRILNAYLDRNPSNNDIKDVLIANSALNRPIKERINAMSLPQGTKQQIAIKQNGVNPREMAISEINYYESEYRNYLNELIFSLSENEASKTEMIEILNSDNKIDSKKKLYEIYLNDENQTNLQGIENELLLNGSTLDYIEFAKLRKEMKTFNSFDLAFANENIKTQITNFSLNSEDIDVKETANAILDFMGRGLDVRPFTIIEPQKSGSNAIQKQNNDVDIAYNMNIAKIYPNPTNGLFTIDLPTYEEGTIAIEIVDLNGKIVYQNQVEQTNSTSIDLRETSKGIYIVKLKIDDTVLEFQKLTIK